MAALPIGKIALALFQLLLGEVFLGGEDSSGTWGQVILGFGLLQVLVVSVNFFHSENRDVSDVLVLLFLRPIHGNLKRIFLGRLDHMVNDFDVVKHLWLCHYVRSELVGWPLV